MPLTDDEVASLLQATCRDPFRLLGLQVEGDGKLHARIWERNAAAVTLLPRDGGAPVELTSRAPEGLFEALVPGASEAFAYELDVRYHGSDDWHRIRDAWSFWPQLESFDLERFTGGQHHHLE